MKNIIILLLFPLFFANAGTRTWDGGGDGTSWNQALNWSDDTIPETNDDVVLDNPGVIIFVTSSVDIQRLSMAFGSTLRVSRLENGPTVTFVANGVSSLNGVDLHVSGGGRLTLPQIEEMRSQGNTFQATGAGSVLSLPNLKRLVSESGGYIHQVLANEGGVVQLPALTTTAGAIVFRAQNRDSRIELDALAAFGSPGGALDARAAGTLVTPNLERVEGASIGMGMGSAMDIGKIASLYQVALQIYGIEPQFPALAELSLVTIGVSGGGRLTLPQIEEMRSQGNTFQATGAGSVLSLPNLKRLVSESGGYIHQVLANEGGVVQLPALTTTAGAIVFRAQNRDSRIELDALPAFDSPGGALDAIAAGTLVTPNLERVEGASIGMGMGSAMDIGKIASLYQVALQIYGIEPQFPALAELSLVTIGVSGGGRLTLPQIEEMRSQGNTFQTTGAGSVLSLPNLKRLVSESGGYIHQVLANEGGVVQLPALTTTAGAIVFRAQNRDSRIELDALAVFGSPGGALDARELGIINAPQLVNVDEVALRINSRGEMRIGTEVAMLTLNETQCDVLGQSTLVTTRLVLGTNSSLLGGGILVGNLENRGVVRIPDALVPLKITGNYDQTATATLDLGISTAQPPNESVQMEVSGNVTLDGSLVMNRPDGLTGQRGDSYRLVTYNSGSGAFRSFNSLNAWNGLQFVPNYGPTHFAFDVTVPGPFFGIDYALLAGNHDFQDQDVVVAASTLIVDGTHKFRSLTVLDGTITCPEFKSVNGFGIGGRLNLEIEQNLTIHPNGHLHADRKGFPGLLGPGAPPSANAGAGHGGWGGGANNGGIGGSPYGSLTQPIAMGSGGGAEDAVGGGVVRLRVGGVIRLEGKISADAAGTIAGGAGGSVTVETQTLTGRGSIAASGGAGDSSGGGGGRIAIAAANIDQFDIRRIAAEGGKARFSFWDGEAGSVFFSVAGKESVEATGLMLDGDSYQGALGPNTQKYFALQVPGGKTIRISLDHSSDTASTELHVAFDRPPSLSRSDFASSSAGKPSQSLIIPRTQSGTYYILARLNSGATDKREFSLKADTLPFRLNEIEPRSLGAEIVTLRVNGSDLKRDTQFTLRRKETGELIQPLNASFEDETKVKVTFDLRGVPAAEYLMVAMNGITEALAPYAIRLEESSLVKGNIAFTPHPGLRRGRPGQNQLSIGNTGDADIEIAIVTLTCENHPEIALSIPSLDIGSFHREGVTQVAEFGIIQITAGETVTIPIFITMGGAYPGSAASIGYSVRFFTRSEFNEWALEEAMRMRMTFLSNPLGSDELRVMLADEANFLADVQNQYLRTGLQSSAVERTWIVFKYGSNSHNFVEPTRIKRSSNLDEFCKVIYIPWVCPPPPENPPPGNTPVPPPGGRSGGSGTSDVSSPRSKDPNTKIGPSGAGETHWISTIGRLPYIILFENQATAEAPAAEVLVEDLIDPNLDLTTFRLGDIQIGSTTVDVPIGRSSFEGRIDLLSTRGVYVDIEAGIDVGARRAFWKFTSIDPNTGLLPESALVGFLPPNGPSGAGEGMVHYEIGTLPNIPSWTLITNSASIVFDVNAPILTKAVTNAIDAIAPTSAITHDSDRPAKGNMVELTAVAGDYNGSGIREVFVYISDNGKPFDIWRSVEAGPVLFEGRPGHRYGVYSVAVDHVGNEEEAPDKLDLLLTFPPVLEVVFDPSKGKVRLTWPGSIKGYSVQKSATLSGTYENLSLLPSRVADEWVVEVEPSEIESYFRLRFE